MSQVHIPFAERTAPAEPWNTGDTISAPMSSSSNANHLPYNQAIAVQERAASKLVIGNLMVDALGNPTKIVDRVKGRKWVMVKVPSNVTTGVYISDTAESPLGPIPSAGEETVVAGWLLYPTDPPLFLPTEASLWGVTTAVGTAVPIQVISGLTLESQL